MGFENIYLSQSIIAKILEVPKSNLHRKILDENIQPMDPTLPRKRYDIKACRKIFSHYLKQVSTKNNKVNVFYNFKGGTGKTTICFQVASMLSLFGYKVLAIDLDPQAHLTNVLRFEENAKIKTSYDILINGEDIEKCICPLYEGLDVVPGNLELTRIEVPLSQKTRREEMLSRVIDQIKSQYDFVLIDTNPTVSSLNVNALFAADMINIVCETQPFSLNGLGILVEELEKIFSDLQKPLNFRVIANKFESKTATAQEVLGVLRADYGKEMTQTIIRKCEDLNIASKIKLPVISFASKNSSGFEDLVDLSKEFIKQ